MSDVLNAEAVAKLSSYAARSFAWDGEMGKSDDEFLQRIWNLAEDLSAIARSHERLREERDAWEMVDAANDRYVAALTDVWRVAREALGTLEPASLINPEPLPPDQLARLQERIIASEGLEPDGEKTP